MAWLAQLISRGGCFSNSTTRKRNEGTQPPGASGSNTLNEPTPMEQDQEEVKLRKSERGRISRRRFEIEGDPGNLILSPKTTTPSVGKRTFPIFKWNRNEWNATEHSLSSGSARHSELWYRLLVYSAGPSCFGLISSGSWVLGISFHWLVQIQYGWCFQEEPFLAWCCNGTFW